ncbi:MAG: DEAD/DEAH box helicase family protein, partial [Pseudomonadota bacterium]
MSDAKHIGVLLPLIFRKSFDYAIPYDMDLQIGDYVKVPFGKKSLWGVVWSQASGDIDPKKVKTIEAVAEHIPAMNENMRKLIEWVAWYSLAPLGQVLKSAMPMQEALDGVKSRKSQPTTYDLQPTTCNLSAEQQQAVDILTKKIGQGFSVSLLDGVTGSGKTEVYFDIIEKLISQDKQVLVMLPEIALSLQWLGRF